MMKTKSSQRWLITQKSHQGCKLATPLLFPNDAPVRRDAPVKNLWLMLLITDNLSAPKLYCSLDDRADFCTVCHMLD